MKALKLAIADAYICSVFTDKLVATSCPNLQKRCPRVSLEHVLDLNMLCLWDHFLKRCDLQTRQSVSYIFLIPGICSALNTVCYLFIFCEQCNAIAPTKTIMFNV